MRQKNNDWFYIAVFIVLAILGFGMNAYNARQICKTADVYWVNGTQYTCRWLK